MAKMKTKPITWDKHIIEVKKAWEEGYREGVSDGALGLVSHVRLKSMKKIKWDERKGWV